MGRCSHVGRRTLRAGLVLLGGACTLAPTLASPMPMTPAPVAQCGEDNFEENDSCATAAPIVVPFIETGLAVYKLDSDYFQVTVEPGDLLEVDALFSHAIADVELYIYDLSGPCGGIFTYLDRSISSDDDESVEWTNLSMSPVDVAIKVEIFPGSIATCNNYDLVVRSSPPAVNCNPMQLDDALEDNDDCSAAVPLPAGLTTDLWVSLDDGDFYSTTLAAGQTIDAQIFFTDSITDVDLFLYDSLGSCGGGFGSGEIASGFTQTNDERIIWSNNSSSPLDVILHVDVFNTGSCNEYDMLIDFDSGGIGTNFCAANPNSTGVVGLMKAFGSISRADNDVTLSARQMPQNQFGLFVASRMQGFIPMAGGSEGNLCLGGSIGRFNAGLTNGGGSAVINYTIDLDAIPQPSGPVSAAAGETWNFQMWHRDTNAAGATSNYTDGITITFQP